jgi:metal-responsive CopG/Arc/MetJ family transcriptional regulator
MKGYKSVSIDEKILQEIKTIIKSNKYLYRNMSEFVNSTLRDKLLEFRKLQLKEREIELMENKKNTFKTLK